MPTVEFLSVLTDRGCENSGYNRPTELLHSGWKVLIGRPQSVTVVDFSSKITFLCLFFCRSRLGNSSQLSAQLSNRSGRNPPF